MGVLFTAVIDWKPVPKRKSKENNGCAIHCSIDWKPVPKRKSKENNGCAIHCSIDWKPVPKRKSKENNGCAIHCSIDWKPVPKKNLYYTHITFQKEKAQNNVFVCYLGKEDMALQYRLEACTKKKK